ncbi:MAG TPA: glycosyltransferase family 2 protein [Phycisphaerae bacterium]|nr:glycosyltransferase family 2 protein [Phycisphaerae bacterium]
MKLLIQIPCYNEEKTLPDVIASLPTAIDGVDEIRTLVIDDGSTDGTIEAARECGVDYIVRNGRNLGLARSFAKGLDACLYLGADLIVNMDGDAQHRGQDVPALVRPILTRKADLVVGARDFSDRRRFPRWKAWLERFGSAVTRGMSGTDVPDVTCGFRAMDRAAAVRVLTLSDYTYTVEMILQAGRTGLKVGWAPIGLNDARRESRLICGTGSFIRRQVAILLKTYIYYCPLRFFSWLAGASFLVSVVAALRLAYYLLFADPTMIKWRSGTGVVFQLGIVATLLFLMAALLGTVLSGLRGMLLDTRSHVRNIELAGKIPPLDCEIITVQGDQALASGDPGAAAGARGSFERDAT